jgi:(+)-trans-carveol dehydrogenase
VRLAQEGADVICVDICGPVRSVEYEPATPDDLAETARLIQEAGRRAWTRIIDVRDHAGLNDAVDAGQGALGVVDIVIANAGIAAGETLLEGPQEDWEEMIAINLTGVYNTIRAGVRGMVQRGAGGAVILISSVAGLKAYGAQGIAYTAAKHGLVGLMRASAHALAPYDIRVNSVHPGNVRTDMTANSMLYQLFRPDIEDPTEEDVLPVLQSMNVLPRPWMQPGDISDAVLFLASDAARNITGVTLPVDMGTMLK